MSYITSGPIGELWVGPSGELGSRDVPKTLLREKEEARGEISRTDITTAIAEVIKERREKEAQLKKKRKQI